jgi:hypothetical protein
VSVAVSSRWFGPAVDPAAVAETLRRMDVRQVYALLAKGAPAPALLAPLRSQGIHVVAVGTRGDAFAAAEAALAPLKASAVVVEGPHGGGESRERDLEALLRALHGPLRRGVPVGVRNDGEQGGLGFEETGHVLDELPGVRLWFDPERARRRESAVPLERWADRYAGRTGGVFLHGALRGASGGGDEGLGPPDDGALDWGTLAPLLPRRVPWVLDLSAKVDEGAARRGALLARSLAGARG